MRCNEESKLGFFLEKACEKMRREGVGVVLVLALLCGLMLRELVILPQLPKVSEVGSLLLAMWKSIYFKTLYLMKIFPFCKQQMLEEIISKTYIRMIKCDDHAKVFHGI